VFHISIWGARPH